MATVSRRGDTPAGPERQRDAERTRREILEVAITEFARDGYSGARVDEIAARTSTTKRMIYYYFGGKEQLYIAALEQAYATARAAEQMDVDHLDPVSAVRTLAQLTFDHHESHPDFVSLVAVENIHHGEFIAKSAAIAALNSPVVSVIARILERGYASGAFKRRAEANVFDAWVSGRATRWTGMPAFSKPAATRAATASSSVDSTIRPRSTSGRAGSSASTWPASPRPTWA
jgi:AcrR family transcriptional regulator